MQKTIEEIAKQLTYDLAVFLKNQIDTFNEGEKVISNLPYIARAFYAGVSSRLIDEDKLSKEQISKILELSIEEAKTNFLK